MCSADSAEPTLVNYWKATLLSLVEKTTAYYETLRHTLKSLTTRGGYGRYFETWNPAVELTEESAVIEGLKHLFVTQSIDQRIEDALAFDR
jgi:hypothetical protein